MKNLALFFLGTSLLLSLSLSAKTVRLKAESPLRKDVKVKLPRGFHKKEKWPLIISLHGYGGNSFIQNYYIRLGRYKNKFGFVFAAPDGIKNEEDKQFWNASNFCCDFDDTQINDVAYVENLIDRIANSPEVGRIDLSKIYLIGYSNGAFLTSKIACESDLPIAGIVTISGTSDLRGDNQELLNPTLLDCSHSRSLKVLHIHGTDDETIRYGGYDNGKTAHVSAEDQIKKWAIHNNCNEKMIKTSRTLNASNFLKGKDTEEYSFNGCRAPVKHFKILEGVHFAIFKKKFTKEILNFLFTE
jgi:polyhydroxybutyrate depolymerase